MMSDGVWAISPLWWVGLPGQVHLWLEMELVGLGRG